MNRRELLGLTAAALVAGEAVARARPGGLDFATTADRPGWPGWTCPGVANLRVAAGEGVLEAGTDVFPSDPRPVAFAVDRRFRDGTISAVVTATGAGAGVVLRRSGPRAYLAAVVDTEQNALVLLRRTPDGVTELARADAPPSPPFTLRLTATGTALTATAGAVAVRATDPRPRAGDPGVLATARTLFPSAGPAALPALGNVHLLPYGVQEGQAFLDTAVGAQVLDRIRERSTARFARIVLEPSGRTRATKPSVIAASAAPGGRLRVAADVPARVEIELWTPGGHRRRLDAGRTDAFTAVIAHARRLPPGTTVHWRARLRRRGRTTVGPIRSFMVPARDRATLAIGACAAQFGPAFDLIAAARPDVFVWQGDLNYPDTAGPLAQTVPGYAGLWRELLANPRLTPILDRTLFAVQRDDHDYGVQDANATNLVPHGLAPWAALMERRTYYRFRAGPADVWVLDQRRHKSDPTAPDTLDKTLLGAKQRAWLLRTLAASRASFKVICSPCTLAPVAANARDGSWAAGFTAERELLLDHVAANVSGRTVFVTGDTHWTLAYETDRLFEARPCPLGIPTPNDITITDPQAAEKARTTPGVTYADDDRGHHALLTVTPDALDLRLVREDGAVPYQRTLKPEPS